MPDQDPILGALGLARRAGALLWGAERVADAIAAHKARLVLLAADAGARTAARFTALCEGGPPCRTLPLTGAALSMLTPRPAAVFAVTDPNFARLCGTHLNDPKPQGGTAHGA